jgi:ribonuclease Y
VTAEVSNLENPALEVALMNPLATAFAGLAVGILLTALLAAVTVTKARRDAAEAQEQAKTRELELETHKKEALLEAKEEAHRLRSEVENEAREQRAELKKVERRLLERDERLDKRATKLEGQEKALTAKEVEAARAAEELKELTAQQRKALEQVSGLSTQQAKQMILEVVEQECQQEMAHLMTEIEEKARRQAERKARNIIALAIQRCAVDQATESTVSVVPLPGDEMKGRIIGREGRNIRAFEALTGVDLIIDDTPEAVVISGFDPIRREIAKRALTNLISDGRIHPARIEDTIKRAEGEIQQRISEEAERACVETGVTGLHPQVAELVGKLTFRTSYGQNCLNHSIEVSHLAAMMAEEIGADVVVARRAGLLHDIGKAVDHEVEGTHTRIAMDILRRHKEPEAVLHAIEAHHEEVPARSVEAVLVQAADAVSASRPGARREMLEAYLKRLEKLEGIANDFEGVERSFAIQAGREIRIIVKPEEIDDLMSVKLAREIAARIQQELQYPGEIQVTVIRETRASAVAQ